MNPEKQALFKKIQADGLLWSYSENADLQSIGEKNFIEQVLKYADLEDMAALFRFWDKQEILEVWESRMKPDTRFKKVNLLIARVFFDMDVEADYFTDAVYEREKKLRLLAQ